MDGYYCLSLLLVWKRTMTLTVDIVVADYSPIQLRILLCFQSYRLRKPLLTVIAAPSTSHYLLSWSIILNIWGFCIKGSERGKVMVDCSNASFYFVNCSSRCYRKRMTATLAMTVLAIAIGCVQLTFFWGESATRLMTMDLLWHGVLDDKGPRYLENE